MKLKINKFYLLGCGAIIRTDDLTLQGSAFTCGVIVQSPIKFKVPYLKGYEDYVTEKSISEHPYGTWWLNGVPFFLPNNKYYKVIKEVTLEEAKLLRDRYRYKKAKLLFKKNGLQINLIKTNKLNFNKLVSELTSICGSDWNMLMDSK